MYVAAAERLVTITQFAGISVADNKVTLSGIDIRNAITMINVTQGGNKINYTKVEFNYIGGGSNDVVITLAGTISGSVNVDIAQGNTVIIQSEQLTFGEIVFESGISGAGYLTGLTRGQNTTITNSVFVKNNIVQSVLPSDIMPLGTYGVSRLNLLDRRLLGNQTSLAHLFLQQ